MRTEKYGLKVIKTGKILGTNITSNADGDFCGDTSTELREGSDTMWLVDTALNAEYVRNFSTPWYNSSNTTPTHFFKSEELQVIKIIQEIIEEPVEVKIPTVKEFYIKKYQKSDPEHLANILDSLDDDRLSPYMFYELEETLNEK